MSDDEDIRTKISNMPLGQVLELKSKIGSNNFNEVMYGKAQKNESFKTDVQFEMSRKKQKNKRQVVDEDEDDAPVEMSSKRPVPFLGGDGFSKRRRKEQLSQVRDPRFDKRCGEYNSARFREDFEFVFEMKQEELKTLKQQLRECTDPEERGRIKFVIQRTQNQIREHHKQMEINKRKAEEKSVMEQARAEGRRPFYVKKSEKRMTELVDKYVELKESGKLKKHIEKRRKRSAGKTKKKMNL